MWKQKAQQLFLVAKNTPKNTQKKIKEALYSIGKDGDFTRIDNKKVDHFLEMLLEDEDLFDSIGDILEFVDKKLTRYQQYKTKKQNKISNNKPTRKTRRNN